MVHTNRRDALRGLAVASLVSWLQGCKDTCPGPGDGPRAPDGTVNVIFHGPFAFIIYQDRIEAITPEMQGHIYGAGTWREEYAMSKGGNYSLQGIKKHTLGKSFEDNKIKFSNVGNIDALTKRYCKVVLPIPVQIVPLAFFNPPGNLFSGQNSSDANKIQALGSVHACVYVDKTAQPLLKGPEWQWKPKKNCLNAINLHIIANSVFQLDSKHPVRSFESLIQMLPPVKIGLNQAAVDKEFEYTDPACSPCAGILRDEQFPLHSTLSLAPPECGVHLNPPRICDAPSVFVSKP